jgi:hypothetical protein
VVLLSAFAVLCSGTPAAAQNPQPPAKAGIPNLPQAPSAYHPITARGRLNWFVVSTVGFQSLAGGLFSAALGTATDSPVEYPPTWEGFGQRYGMRLTGVSVGNAMEASLGALWGEDPRYFRAPKRPVKARVKNVLDLTFRAYRPDDERHLAWARYTAIVGNNFLSNTWRVPSEDSVESALLRSLEGVGARALSNGVKEFAPELARPFHRFTSHH